MKAILCPRYGSPDFIRYAEVDKPAPSDDEILIRVRAASVNPLDWHLKRGTPYIGRLALGIREPGDPRMGRDVAGEIEAVGRNVTRLRAGDAVFGVCDGAFAEYAVAKEDKVALKSPALTFEQAASLPIAGLTALQGLRDKGHLLPGQKVLIHGASGGVGTFTVQIAKWLGAEVTGVCSTRNVDLVRSLGADHVVDYTREDFTRGPRQYDVLFDAIGDRPLSACRRVVTSQGMYLGIGVRTVGRWVGPLPRIIRLVMGGSFRGRKAALFVAKLSPKDLTLLNELIDAKTVTPIIERTYPLAETAEAVRHLASDRARGKIVITV